MSSPTRGVNVDLGNYSSFTIFKFLFFSIMASDCFCLLWQIVDLLKKLVYDGAVKIQLKKDITIRVINAEVLPDRGIAFSNIPNYLVVF